MGCSASFLEHPEEHKHEDSHKKHSADHHKKEDGHYKDDGHHKEHKKEDDHHKEHKEKKHKKEKHKRKNSHGSLESVASSLISDAESMIEDYLKNPAVAAAMGGTVLVAGDALYGFNPAVDVGFDASGNYQTTTEFSTSGGVSFNF